MKKKLAALAPLLATAVAFAEGETTTTYDVTTFWNSLNINFGELIMQGAAILGVIMLAIVSTVTILLFWTRKKWVYDG